MPPHAHWKRRKVGYLKPLSSWITWDFLMISTPEFEAAKANKNISLGTTILRFHRRWGTDPDQVRSHRSKKSG